MSRRAQQLACNGRLSEAIALFRRGLSLDPADVFSHLHLALALAESGELDEARAAALRAVERAPDRPAVQLLAGRVHYDAGDFESARRAFEAALSASPGNDLARAYRILVDWAAGDRDAWRRLSPEDLPDSVPFLVRWLERIECELRPSAGPKETAPKGTPPFRPGRRRRVAFSPQRKGRRLCG